MEDETRIAIERLQQALGDLPERLAEVLRGDSEPVEAYSPARPGLPEGDETEIGQPKSTEVSEFQEFPARPGFPEASESQESPQRPDFPEASESQESPQRPDFPEAAESEFPERQGGAEPETSYESRQSPLGDTEDESEEPGRQSPFASAATESDSSGLESKLDELKVLLTEIRDKLGENTDTGVGGGGAGGPPMGAETPATRPFAPMFNGMSIEDMHGQKTVVNVRTRKDE